MKRSELFLMNNGLYSHAIHAYYLKNTVSAWRLSHQQVYTTDHGAMPMVPFTNIEKVITKQGRNYPKQSHEMIDRITERYLASVGAYVIVTDEGVAFVESENPPIDLRAYMAGIFNKYTCPTCGVQYLSNDNIDIIRAWAQANQDKNYKEVEPIVLKDHAGEECPQCKKGIVKHVNTIDIEKNMERINKLIAYVNAKNEEEDRKKDRKTTGGEISGNIVMPVGTSFAKLIEEEKKT